MVINWGRREVNVKIVYYGPPLSGKTTNLVQIHTHIDPHRRGELISLKTAEDRTLFFDFLRLDLAKIGGMRPRIHLYTVPGQPLYEASRRLVLRGADGLVFVADSSRTRVEGNRNSLASMRGHLRSFALSPDQLPLVVQLNKRDLPDALPAAELERLLELDDVPTFEAVAVQGIGVYDTLKAIIHDVIVHLQNELN
jgi:signal recognition particle receptor subunit beta